MGHEVLRMQAATIGLCGCTAHRRCNFQDWEGCETTTWAMENPRKSLILVRLAGIEFVKQGIPTTSHYLHLA